MRPPATRQPNAWGLYDMLGNVGEWVEQGNATERYAKGGSYRSSAAKVNSSDRQYYRRRWQQRDGMDPPSKWQMSDAPFIGFRLVADEDPPAIAPAL